jgi:hypothetical protein
MRLRDAGTTSKHGAAGIIQRDVIWIALATAAILGRSRVRAKVLAPSFKTGK